MIVERAYAHVRPEQATDWPWTVPCVRQLLADGLRFTAPVTFLVGENGSGKSTLVEAPAEGYGLDPWGGSAGHRRGGSRERSPLDERVRFEAAAAGGRRPAHARLPHRPPGVLPAGGDRPRRPGPRGFGPDFRSHGEGFLAAFRDEFRGPGLFVLDESEAALSFTSCPELVGHLAQVVEHGGQVVCATHSPLLTALPGAEILELDEDGLRRVAWEELRLVDHWRRHLADPRKPPGPRPGVTRGQRPAGGPLPGRGQHAGESAVSVRRSAGRRGGTRPGTAAFRLRSVVSGATRPCGTTSPDS